MPRFLNYLLFLYLTRVMTVGEYGVVTDLYALIPFVLLLLTMASKLVISALRERPAAKRKKADDLFERMAR